MILRVHFTWIFSGKFVGKYTTNPSMYPWGWKHPPCSQASEVNFPNATWRNVGSFFWRTMVDDKEIYRYDTVIRVYIYVIYMIYIYM